MGEKKTEPLPGLRTWNSNNNAVVWAGFGARLDAMPTPQTVGRLVGLHDRLKSEYPRMRTKPVEKGSRGEHGNGQIEGVLFSQPRAGDDSVRRIRFEGEEVGQSKSSLSIRRDDYITWKTTWEREVRGIFGMMLPPLLKEANMTEIDLIMRRRFVWDTEPDSQQLLGMFREDSPLLPPAFFQEEAVSYSQFAYTSGVRDRRGKEGLMANQVSIEMILDESGKEWGERWIDIEIYQILFSEFFHESRARRVRTGTAASTRHIEELLDHYMGILHQENQQALSDILGDAARKKFGVRTHGNNENR